jgi:hypothetical protein
MSSSRRRVAPVVVVLAAGLASVVAGCGLVVGAGDYVVGTADASSADAGSAGNLDGSPNPEAQAPPPGGDSEAPPADASAAPDAPTTVGPTEAGTTSDGGPTVVCAADGTLVPGGLPTGDAAFQQRVNACVLAVTCDPQYFEVPISDCITSDYLGAQFTTPCLANIKSCDDYYACRGDRIATPAECPDSNGIDVGSCSASGVATNCFAGGGGIVSNCAMQGGTCVVYDEPDFSDNGDTAAGCQVGTCNDSSTEDNECASASQIFICTATDSGDIEIGRNCPSGSTCQTSKGKTDCFETTSACTTPGTTCTSGNLTTCQTLTSGNQVYTGNCSVAGLVCDTTSSTGACAAPGCQNSGCSETCVGNSLQLCIGGAPFTVDCTTLGFDTCNSDINHPDINYCVYE